MNDGAGEELQVLGRYQKDIGNLRSHHWKYWVDLYTHCYYDCAYCVYRSEGKMGRVQAHPDRLEGLRRDLAGIQRKGIVYLGPKADVYQPLDRRELLARRALEVFLETRTPVFLVTRSELVLRDLDLLEKLASQGLVEVSITVASRTVLSKLEPHTLPAAERLALVRQLRARGIATSVHMSPIIPGVDDINELLALLDDIGESGADCSYACMLGVTKNYHSTIVNALQASAPSKVEPFLKVYPAPPEGDGVQSAPGDLVFETMSRLSYHASTQALPFACVHIPPFDTVERCGGIFRYKLPTVGDIVRYCNRICLNELQPSRLEAFLKSFPAVDDLFLGSVQHFWQSGILFKNTPFHPRGSEGNISAYVREGQLDLGITNMRVN
jgi:DNA repair photolyase